MRVCPSLESSGSKGFCRFVLAEQRIDKNEDSKNDVLSGGDGNDILMSDHVPAVKDIVSCGGGFDRVVADNKDVVADDCEKVLVVHGSKAEVLKQEDTFYKSLPPAQGKFFDTFFEEQLAPFPNG